MAAGLGFKTFNTGDVLSAADVNGYLMQGVLVFADATARDAAITSPQEGQFAYTKNNDSLWYYSGSAWVASGATGDIEGVTAGTGISGGGTSGTVTITNSMATAIDAKGDLVVGTGADTFSRLAVGTNGYLLTADSTEATGMKWAAAAGGGSGLTLIKRATFTDVADTSTTFDSIFTSTYKAYQVVIERLGSPTAPDREARMQLFYSGTLQTADYLGGVGKAPYTGSLGIINNNVSAQYTFANQIGSSSFLNSYVMWFNYVGNASECANWYGLGYQGNTGDGVFFGGGTQTSRTYTGFQIKASSGNVTGTIAIYGLATS